MKILISGNKNKNDFYKHLEIIISYIAENTKWSIYIDNDLKNSCGGNNFSFFSFNDIDKNNFDFVISLGGDGAILSLVKKMRDFQIPILGIHIGNLGFLNHCNISVFTKYIDFISDNNIIKYKKHNLIEANFKNENSKEINITALNDIVVNQQEIPRLLNLDVYVDDSFLNTFNADGIIFASPLGSTAYSLSSGGPIISPDVGSIILTPISPHTLATRPIILNSNSKIKVVPANSKSIVSVSSDGQEIHSVLSGVPINLKISNKYAKFIYTGQEDCYYKKLRNKLGW